MNIEEEIALKLVDVALENNWFDVVVAEDIAAALMPLVRRAQASKVREVAELVMDPHNGLPFDTDHDLAIVSAWLYDVADRIEQEA